MEHTEVMNKLDEGGSSLFDLKPCLNSVRGDKIPQHLIKEAPEQKRPTQRISYIHRRSGR